MQITVKRHLGRPNALFGEFGPRQLAPITLGVWFALSAWRSGHSPAPLRLAEGLALLGLGIAIAVVRPYGRSLLAWARVALEYRGAVRAYVWTSHRAGGGSAAPLAGPRPGAAVPPHLAALGISVGGEEPAPAGPRPRGHRGRPRLPRSREGDGSHRATTQDLPFIPVSYDNDVLTFADGSRAAVFEGVGPNTRLMAEDGLKALHAAFHHALLGLPFPWQYQIVVGPDDARAYIEARIARLERLPPEIARVECADIAFMKHTVRTRGFVDLRVYAIIPIAAPQGLSPSGIAARLQGRAGADTTATDEEARQVLEERCDDFEAVIRAARVIPSRLAAPDLKRLIYELCNGDAVALQPFDEGYGSDLPRPHLIFAPEQPAHRAADIEGGHDDHHRAVAAAR